MRLARSLLLGGLVAATGASFYCAWQESCSLRASLEQQPVRHVRVLAKLPQLVLPGPYAGTDGEHLSTLEFDGDDETFDALDLTAVQPAPARERRRVSRPAVEASTPPAAVEAEEVDVGDLARRAVRSKQTLLQLCYEQELKKQAAFDGFVVVALSVGADGRVESAVVEEGTRRDAKVGACIASHLKTLKFPPLGEAVELELPIRLQAQELANR
jgi:hypothetical protein